MTLNEDLRLSQTKISNFVDDGEKEVFEVKTVTGREIEVTAPHPFLTISGWKPMRELKVGGYIATPRVIPIFGNKRIPTHQVKAIAYFISDGGLTGGCPRFTNINPIIVDDFTDAIMDFDGVIVRKYDSNGTRTPTYEVVKDKIDRDKINRDFSVNLQSLIKSTGITQVVLLTFFQAVPLFK